MNRRLMMAVLLPLAGILILLAIAYGGVVLQEKLRQEVSRTFSLDLITLEYWASALVAVLSAGVLLGLFWWVLNYSPGWIGTLYLIVGIILLLFPIGFFYLLQRVHYFPYITVLMGLYNSMIQKSLFYGLSGGIALIGLFKLVLPRSLALKEPAK